MCLRWWALQLFVNLLELVLRYGNVFEPQKRSERKARSAKCRCENRRGLFVPLGTLVGYFLCFIIIFSIEVSVLKNKNTFYSLITGCALFFISSLMEKQVRLII